MSNWTALKRIWLGDEGDPAAAQRPLAEMPAYTSGFYRLAGVETEQSYEAFLTEEERRILSEQRKQNRDAEDLETVRQPAADALARIAHQRPSRGGAGGRRCVDFGPEERAGRLAACRAFRREKVAQIRCTASPQQEVGEQCGLVELSTRQRGGTDEPADHDTRRDRSPAVFGDDFLPDEPTIIDRPLDEHTATVRNSADPNLSTPEAVPTETAGEGVGDLSQYLTDEELQVVLRQIGTSA